MRRSSRPLVVLAVSAFFGAGLGLLDRARAQAPDFEKVEIKARPVAGKVTMLEGAGGNIAVSVGEDGILLVDDQFAPLGAKIKKALAALSDKPTSFVVNTHWHGDHSGGNEVFGSEATLISHVNARRRMAEPAPARKAGSVEIAPRPAYPKVALPVVTFDHALSLHQNGEEIRVLHFPRGHTDGDVIVWFTGSNVVHMGDQFVTYGFPFIDLGSGGSVRGLIKNLGEILKLIPADARIIPGHGQISTVRDVERFRARLVEIVARVEGEIKKGKTLEQLIADRVLAPYADWEKSFVKPHHFLEMLYKELHG